MPCFYYSVLFVLFGNCASFDIPLIINTWNFVEANKKAWQVLTAKNGNSVLDAIEAGCSECEFLQCDGTVGYGGSPDEAGETTLDALMMDGSTMNVGAVAALRRVKNAISVARCVLEHSRHSMLVGDQATQFALQMGFSESSLSTENSTAIWNRWKENSCQPNFWMNVIPDPKTTCGPYIRKTLEQFDKWKEPRVIFDRYNHDTIGMIAIDEWKNVAVGTSTNGARHKFPGRVGDSPIVGAGGYAEKNVGGAAATGDGDILMRFLPSFKAVELLKSGLPAEKSAEMALENIVKYYKNFSGAIIVATVAGDIGAACHGFDNFPFTISSHSSPNPISTFVKCR